MIPHERSLVQRLENRPFILIGVNFDEDRDKLKKVIGEEGITWRSWWDAADRIGGQWGVQSIPTTYLIDHKGVIRHKNPRGRELDEAIDRLVQEAESEK
jgi:hypothetical protein